MIIFINILVVVYLLVTYGFLTNNQLQSIGKILTYNTKYKKQLSPPHFNELNTIYKQKYNKTFSEIVYETKMVLFHHSLPFVYTKYKSFTDSSVVSKQLSYTDKNILLRYGYMGLWRAINSYNGTSNFYKYSSIYISSEFKRCLTDLNTNYILPHRLRVNKEFLKSNNMSDFRVTLFSHIDSEYHKNLESTFTNICHIESFDTLYEILQTLPQKDRNYFRYRYNIYTCKIERTNKEVAQLMCVSEETTKRNNSCYKRCYSYFHEHR